ncbi:MAG: LytTR family DNA-binding domain-containing protein [Brevundimonas sp.]
MSGAAARAADLRILRIGYLVMAPISVLVCVVNTLTRLADAPALRSWEPWTWELTSAAAFLAVLLIPWAATLEASPDDLVARVWRPRLRFALVHAVGLLAFSGLHVGLFVLLRSLVYELMNAGPYEFGDRFVYELRKDALTYAICVAGFWMLARLDRRQSRSGDPRSFDIRDGARIIRVPPAQILAVTSAGNYVEFWLSDGRRPLMRATLAAIEAELLEYGFLRTHRRWLVNTAHVVSLTPQRSGDWMIDLGGVEAPLSRRYGAARARLVS